MVLEACVCYGRSLAYQFYQVDLYKHEIHDSFIEALEAYIDYLDEAVLEQVILDCGIYPKIDMYTSESAAKEQETSYVMKIIEVYSHRSEEYLRERIRTNYSESFTLVGNTIRELLKEDYGYVNDAKSEVIESREVFLQATIKATSEIDVQSAFLGPPPESFTTFKPKGFSEMKYFLNSANSYYKEVDNVQASLTKILVKHLMEDPRRIGSFSNAFKKKKGLINAIASEGFEVYSSSFDEEFWNRAIHSVGADNEENILN